MSLGFWTDEKIDFTITRDAANPAHRDRHNPDFLPVPFLVIGSSTRCDVVLDCDSIPARAFCVCLDSKNRLWGAMLVRRSRQSKVGFRRIDTERGIKIGEFRLQFAVRSHSENGVQGNGAQENGVQENGVQENGVQENGVQENGVQENGVQENGVQENDHRRCILKWRTGDETHLVRLRPNRPIMLGRELPSQLQVDHISISAAHCCLLFDGSQLWVIDAGSTNKIRSVDGSAAVLCIQDRQVFAAGRVQFKVAIPTDLVPLAELEKLRSNIEQHELDVTYMRQREEDLGRYRFELDAWLDDLRCEQDAWLRRRDSVNQEIQERLVRLEGRETALDESIEEWETNQEQRKEELHRLQAELAQREATLTAIEESWDTKHATAETHWNSIAEEVRRHKLVIRQQQAELQRQNELAVVQRIRIQRELKEREAKLDEREKELIRREVQIDAAQRRLPRDVSNPNPEFELPSDSISDSTVLAANDFIDILDQALDNTDRRA